MTFERYTERARQVVVLAQEEARGLRHGWVGTEHVLLGLLREEGSLAARVLNSLDITTDRTRAQVVRICHEGHDPVEGQIPFTPRAKKVLELALREALSLGHNYIGTEHILLAIVRENEGVAARILRDFDVDPERTRNEVIRDMNTRGRPTAPKPPKPSTYAVHVRCGNCFFEADVELPKGQAVFGSSCVHCGCASLESLAA